MVQVKHHYQATKFKWVHFPESEDNPMDHVGK